MEAIAGGWIPTERTHPDVWRHPLGVSLFIVALVVAILLVSGMRPSLAAAFGLAVVFGLILGFVSSVLVVTSRPAAIRVSARGIEVRRTVFGTAYFPAAGVVTLTRKPDGFGYLVSGSEGGGYFLSPNQFAAVKATFPGRE